MGNGLPTFVDTLGEHVNQVLILPCKGLTAAAHSLLPNSSIIILNKHPLDTYEYKINSSCCGRAAIVEESGLKLVIPWELYILYILFRSATISARPSCGVPTAAF